MTSPRLIARARAALIYLLAAAAPLAARAQYAGPTAGVRVRVTAPAAFTHPFVGTLLEHSPDTLLVAKARGRARISISTAAVQQLEVSEGRARRHYAIVGGLVGLVGGATIGAVAASSGGDRLAGLGGLLLGGIVGAPAGAVTGALVAPERWRRHYLPQGDGR